MSKNNIELNVCDAGDAIFSICSPIWMQLQGNGKLKAKYADKI